MFCSRTTENNLEQRLSTKQLSERVILALIKQDCQHAHRLISKLHSNSLRSKFGQLAEKIELMRQELDHIRLIKNKHAEHAQGIIEQLNHIKVKQRYRHIDQATKQTAPIISSDRIDRQDIELQERKNSSKSSKSDAQRLKHQLQQANNKTTKAQERLQRSKRKMHKKIILLQERITDLTRQKARTNELLMFQPLSRQLQGHLLMNPQSPEEEMRSVITLSVKQNDPAEFIQYLIVIRRKENVSSALVVAQALRQSEEERRKSMV